MNKKRQREIEEMTLNILKELGAYSVPILVDEIVRKKGIVLEDVDFGDEISGVFISNGTTHKIGYNTSNHPNRQRFTIAHEFGHYALNHKRKGVFVDTPNKFFTILFRDANSSTGEYLQEREANIFAANLLMPRELIEEKVIEICKDKSFFNSDKDIVKLLADDFKVSYQAMALRLSYLDYKW